MTERIDAREFWTAQEPDIGSMFLNRDAATKLGEQDYAQIVETLPPLEGVRILELGAGIGRFTRHFAENAEHVTAVDFSEKFLETNQKANAAYSNVTFLSGDVMDLSFQTGNFHLVFSNWLLMYLEDCHVERLFDQTARWLDRGGLFFFRESCLTSASGLAASPTNPGRYRDPGFYEHHFEKRFEVIRRGHILIYEQVYNNPNQCFWLLRAQSD